MDVVAWIKMDPVHRRVQQCFRLASSALATSQSSVLLQLFAGEICRPC